MSAIQVSATFPRAVPTDDQKMPHPAHLLRSFNDGNEQEQRERKHSINC
ncbi:hypothetical protein HMPREF0973_02538 [Prevotella veroralis F0319]|uniref:Uncharacterized protein n=1 Tax=Prevotella veroralis F0319 TaxID=649761 RepID=C9MSC0_9BACT|nr:hypothetical protein HMPREF0973_02538 [Prevotella veroralis F0319]